MFAIFSVDPKLLWLVKQKNKNKKILIIERAVAILQNVDSSNLSGSVKIWVSNKLSLNASIEGE